jgi:hypothetical protein
MLVCAASLGAMTVNALAASAAPQSSTDKFKNLEFREIGPAVMGGRIDDFAVVESNPNIVYVGTASGGVWKTTNNGTTWAPVFDKEGVSTIGDIAIAPSDPSVVWVGTGEPNNRQSSSWGDGVYKSLDAGKTWKKMGGLEATHHIGRIVIHPKNPDVAYVAAQGHLWGPNPERGVYKTSDGGKTWAQVLKINDDTGVSDMVMDPESPDILYAAAYERRRTPFGFNGGGPDSAIYKTTDGGTTWKKLTKGLPYENGGDTGRIGLDIYRKDPNIVYPRSSTRKAERSAAKTRVKHGRESVKRTRALRITAKFELIPTTICGFGSSVRRCFIPRMAGKRLLRSVSMGFMVIIMPCGSIPRIPIT